MVKEEMSHEAFRDAMMDSLPLYVENDIRAELDPLLNEGQKSALLLMLRFIEEIDMNMFVLKGYAGTGKSFLINRFLREAIKTRNSSRIVITAPTNKAVKVLKKGADSQLNIRYLTIHSLLGLTQKIDSKGRISFTAEKKSKHSIQDINVLIVDETSMLDDHLFGLLKQAVEFRKGFLRVIFVGDYAQIPPVGKEDCIPFKEGLSQGYSEEGYTLTKIMRQSNENPIVSIAYNIRENLKDPYVTASVKTDIKRDQGILVINDSALLTNYYTMHFGTLTFNVSSDYAKVIAWTNATVKTHNGIIRNILFNNPRGKIVAGDKLIANSPILVGKDILYNTSDEFEVASYTIKQEKYNSYEGPIFIKVYEASVRAHMGSKVFNKINILHEDSYKDFDDTLRKLKDRAVQTSHVGNWIHYYDFLKLVADVSYNYAITAHKAQGSTYENVFIIEDDIDKNQNVVERNRIKYTAYTRASKRLFIYKKV